MAALRGEAYELRCRAPMIHDRTSILDGARFLCNQSVTCHGYKQRRTRFAPSRIQPGGRSSIVCGPGRHLRVLREARLVVDTRIGRERVYAVNPVPLQSVAGWLEGYRAFWQASLTKLKRNLEAK